MPSFSEDLKIPWVRFHIRIIGKPVCPGWGRNTLRAWVAPQKQKKVPRKCLLSSGPHELRKIVIQLA